MAIGTPPKHIVVRVLLIQAMSMDLGCMNAPTMNNNDVSTPPIAKFDGKSMCITYPLRLGVYPRNTAFWSSIPTRRRLLGWKRWLDEPERNMFLISTWLHCSPVIVRINLIYWPITRSYLARLQSQAWSCFQGILLSSDTTEQILTKYHQKSDLSRELFLKLVVLAIVVTSAVPTGQVFHFE